MGLPQIAPYFSSVIETIGNTPLVRLNYLTQGLGAEVLLKCEFRNPLFSVKDRVGAAMIATAEQAGLLTPQSTIVEPTSGNTGIALAFVARAKGYKCVLVMSDSMSAERRTLLRMLGAELVLSPAALGMRGTIAAAEQIVQDLGTLGYMPQQFENPANPAIHYASTGPEIWEATQGRLDAFVAGVGTGGTISGVGRYLKEKNPAIQIIAVEPSASPVISGGVPAPHKIQGIGAGFIPKNLDVSLLDKVITITNEQAMDTARAVAAQEGIPVGISSGANVAAALQLAASPAYAGKRIVTVAPSSLERYLSTELCQ